MNRFFWEKHFINSFCPNSSRKIAFLGCGISSIRSCQDLFAFMDQMQVAGVNEKTAGLAQDEYRILAVNCIGKQRKTAEQAENPEGSRNQGLLLFFRIYPLHQEAHGEKKLTD